jgi:hypothetical protein
MDLSPFRIDPISFACKRSATSRPKEKDPFFNNFCPGDALTIAHHYGVFSINSLARMID